MVASRSSTAPSSGGSGRVDAELPALRPGEADTARVQEHALQTQLPHGLVEAGVTVLLVARHRVPGVLGVHADLVRAAGLERHLQEGRDPAEELHRDEKR